MMEEDDDARPANLFPRGRAATVTATATAVAAAAAASASASPSFRHVADKF